MKRTPLLRLIMMGSAPFALSACGGEPEPAYVYNSPEECIRDGQLGEDACRAEYETAKTEHARTAPRYNNQADCENDFGANACQATPGFGSSFMPLMAGYMVGRMMSPRAPNDCRSRAQGCDNNAAGGSGFYRAFRSQPLYKSRDDWRNFRTAGNDSVGARTGFTYVDPGATRPSVAPKVLTRGGFGARAGRSGFHFGG